MPGGGPLIRTPRLELIPATPALLDAALDGAEALAARLGAEVPASWPPEHLDAAALRYIRARLGEAASGEARWWLYLVLLREDPARRVVIGTAGYKGPPDATGTVEVGYSIVSDRQRRGYASEAVVGLVGSAFAEPGVRRVVAETFPDHVASIGVLEKNGFRRAGSGTEPGTVLFEKRRGGDASGPPAVPPGDGGGGSALDPGARAS